MITAAVCKTAVGANTITLGALEFARFSGLNISNRNTVNIETVSPGARAWDTGSVSQSRFPAALSRALQFNESIRPQLRRVDAGPTSPASFRTKALPPDRNLGTHAPPLHLADSLLDPFGLWLRRS